MVLSDWTFGDDLDTILIGTTAPAPDTSESAPYIVVSSGGSHAANFLYPTNNTINGISTLGRNVGQASWWSKTNVNTLGSETHFWFRVTDTLTSATTDILNGYLLVIGATSGVIYNYTAGTPNSVFTTTGVFNGPTWVQRRMSWWESAGNLYLKYEDRQNSANAWVQRGSTTLDSVNAHKSNSNKILFEIKQAGTRIEGLRISSTISA